MTHLALDLRGHPRLRRMFTLPVRYAMADGGRSEVLIGDGPGESILDRVPLVMIRRRSTTDTVVLAADSTFTVRSGRDVVLRSKPR